MGFVEFKLTWNGYLDGDTAVINMAFPNFGRNFHGSIDVA